jgi:hypothetical protein
MWQLQRKIVQKHFFQPIGAELRRSGPMILLTYKECEVGKNVEREQPRGAPDAAPFLYLFN